ncbi:hypothetical protein F542_14740 [Bibersteinia trehalosi USDA-ARS-USMARC-188]|uniref:Uncharacterized protein n=1 Tax=Bibersteinia trehalosi USDA-ARS-USMARC-188 TaxID=1263829 RepID=A0A4V7IAQ9_BIBTR|nr:YdbH family protein [Bibersteinia trehalosi]AHG82190.1 hypothetical protein F542_14740 [Bibersteinia trehalosi USDA-ARS-USMARC-188]
MIIRRTLLILAALLAVLLASGAALMTGSQLSSALNLVLPEEWRIETPLGLEADLEKAQLPSFTLHYQHCPLLSATQLKVQWWQTQQIQLQSAEIDYYCLSMLLSRNAQSSSENASTTLSSLLALLPEGEAAIKQLHWKNLPDDLSPHLHGLLASPSEIRFAFFQQKLTAYIGQALLNLTAELQHNQLGLQAHYQLADSEQHHLSAQATLADSLTQLPLNLNATYRWQLPETRIALPDLQQGNAQLVWQTEDDTLQGNLVLQSASNTQNQLHLPFKLNAQHLQIEQARIDWDLIPEFPLRAFINATFTPKSFRVDDLLPIETAVRISLLSQNAKGKGNVVINNLAGRIEADKLSLPLQITGNIKYDDYILYSTIPLDIQGSWQDLQLKFLPKALLRLTGTERFLTIHDLRFPLAGIRVDKYGISGRLQSIFRGESPDFKNIEIHLDGYAKNFKAGALSFFQTPNEKNAVKDQWNWRFWGNTQFNTLKSRLNVAGRGNWHKNLIRLNEFKGELAQIKQNGITIPKTELTLQKPIKFWYERFELDGIVRLTAPKIAFDYGGELEQPTADLSFNGETENLKLKGILHAGKLGPIRLFARRHLTENASDLIGRLYWAEQPANVFQSLFPFRHHWVITQGSIKGETAFSANAKRGLIAGGHFAIRQGAVSLPSGELKGIEFSLPYQFKQGAFALGLKQPVAVKIAEINLGLPITNVSAKVQGYYPYTPRKPLQLRELSMQLLDGSLNVERFALPQTQVAQLNLSQINLAKILEFAQYQQINLTGRINGKFPFWLSGKPCYICNGSISQSGKSHLKFTPELMQAIQKAGYTERILSYTVNDSLLNEFSATLNLATNGDMQLNAKVRSQLVEHQNTKINIHYHHQENMFALWRLINAGTQLEQRLEHELYKKLDGNK